AERNMSLSRYVGELLRERMRHSREYEAAMKGWLAEKPLKLTGPWKPYPKREELYDRPVLRRR
ncbi:MAG: CopG family transcriptional regulator, partial [Burkholderiales bacterium]